MIRAFSLLAAVLLAMPSVLAADIQGVIIIERKLTKRNVTPAVGLYQRGAAVDLGEDALSDPLGYERSHTAIYLEGAVPFKATPSGKSVAIEQRERRFVPDLIVIPAGATVAFPNFDPVFHNVFSLSKTKEFDLGNYPKNESRNVTFNKAGIVNVYCHLHPNMAASIVVAPNVWNTLADTTGRFAIPDVPPGNYTIVAWHKTAGFFRQPIAVTENGAAPVRFVLPLPLESSSSDHTDHPVARR